MCHTALVPNIGTPTITVKRSDLKPKAQLTARQLLKHAERTTKSPLSEADQAMLERMQARRNALRNR